MNEFYVAAVVISLSAIALVAILITRKPKKASAPKIGLIATGSEDHEVRIYSRNNKILKTLGGNAGPVNSVTFSWDGTRVVSGGEDGAVRVWDTKTGFRVLFFTDHTEAVNSVSWGEWKGNKFIASASDDKTVLVRHVNGRNTLETFVLEHPDRVLSVALYPKDTGDIGKLLVTGCADHKIRIWDYGEETVLHQNWCTHEFPSHSKAVTSVAWSPNGDLIASGSADTDVRIWDALSLSRTGKPGGGNAMKVFKGHTDRVTSVAFGPSDAGTAVVSGSVDQTVRVWDIEGNRVGLQINPDRKNVLSVAWSASLVAFTDGDNWHMWNAADGRTVPTGVSSTALSVAFTRGWRWSP